MTVNAIYPWQMTVEKLQETLAELEPKAIVAYRDEQGVYHNIKLDHSSTSIIVFTEMPIPE